MKRSVLLLSLFVIFLVLFVPSAFAVVNISANKTSFENPGFLPSSRIVNGNITKGSIFNYQINISNNGDETIFVLNLTEVYPQGTVFNNASPAPDAGTNNTWTNLTRNLAAGGFINVNISVNLSSNTANGTALNNSVNITYTNTSNATVNLTQKSFFLTARGIPSINITKTDTPDPVNINGFLTYFVNLTNIGDDVAVNVTVVDLYPQGVNFSAGQPSPVIGNNTFSVNNMTPAQSIVVNITVNITGRFANASVIDNTANATYTTFTGFNITNTSAVQQTTVRGYPNLNVTKTDSVDPVTRNTLFNYTVRINNTGNDTAINVTLIETYPQGVFLVAGQPAPNVGNNTWNLGNLSPGGEFLVNITLNYTGILANATVINNTVNTTFVNVQGVSVNTNHSQVNNSVGATQNTTTRGLPVIVVTKTDSPDPVTSGAKISYQLLVNSSGEDTAFGVNLTEGYPLNTRFDSSIPEPNVSNNLFLLGDLTPGQIRRLNITVDVASGLASGVILNNTVNYTWANFIGQINNSNTSQITEVLASQESGGSGGGGGSGIAATTTTTEAPAVTAAVTTSNIVQPQELKTIIIDDPILNAVVFIPAVQVNPSITAKSLKEKPESILAHESANVYAYISIDTNLQSRDLYYAAIKFSVLKSWVQEKGLKPSQIVLNRLVNNQWIKLKTPLKSESDDKYNFEALTPGFSYFAITAEQETAPAETAAEAPALFDETLPVQTETVPATLPAKNTQPTTQDSAPWIIALIVLVGVIVAIVLLRKKTPSRYK